jgi:hypothetical protein
LKILGEVSAGRACVGVNEKELTRCGKKEGQEEEKGWGRYTKGDPLAIARSLIDCGLLLFFHYFFYFFALFFGCYEDGPGILGEWVYSTSIFWTLPLHLGGWNLPFLIELGDFIFFPKFLFAKIRVHQDLNIHRWDFCLMKNWIH